MVGSYGGKRWYSFTPVLCNREIEVSNGNSIFSAECMNLHSVGQKLCVCVCVCVCVRVCLFYLRLKCDN